MLENIKKRKIAQLTKMSSGSRDRVRELVRIRDDHTCQICGKKWKPGMRRFDIHHKDFDKEKTRACENYQKEKNNMTTLCHKCHLNLPEHRESMRVAQLKALRDKHISLSTGKGKKGLTLYSISL